MATAQISIRKLETAEYALIEAQLARARRLRSEAVEGFLASFASSVQRGFAALVDAARGARRHHRLGAKPAR